MTEGCCTTYMMHRMWFLMHATNYMPTTLCIIEGYVISFSLVIACVLKMALLDIYVDVVVFFGLVSHDRSFPIS